MRETRISKKNIKNQCENEKKTILRFYCTCRAINICKGEEIQARNDIQEAVNPRIFSYLYVV